MHNVGFDVILESVDREDKMRQALIKVLLQNGFKSISGKNSFYRMRHDSVTITLYTEFFTYYMVERGGAKEGWENRRFNYTPQALKLLQKKLVWN